jgi:hypothetical protein
LLQSFLNIQQVHFYHGFSFKIIPLSVPKPADEKIALDRRRVFAESQASFRFYKDRFLQIGGGVQPTACRRGG